MPPLISLIQADQDALFLEFVQEIHAGFPSPAAYCAGERIDIVRELTSHPDTTFYAVNEQDFRWVVIHEFERHGWRVQDVYIGNPMKHHEKYLEINEAFAGRRKLMPFLNRQNNEDLILALQTAGVSRGRNGFRMDKGGGKTRRDRG